MSASSTTGRPTETVAPKRGSSRRHWLLPVGATLFLVAFLLPVIHAPFFSDDITSSEINGYRVLHGDSVLGLYADLVWNFVVHGGRPQILSGLPGYPVFVALGDDPVAYHVFILALTAIDAVLVYGLMRRLRMPAAGAALVVVLAAGWMQFRIYHDSMISFAGLVQVVFGLVVGSAWAFSKWLDEGRTRDLVIAVALFFAACGVYEVAYSLCAVHIALALTHRRGMAAARAAAPFVAVAALFALATLAGRLFSDAVATGYSVGGGGPWTILRTYAVQLVSPLPAMSIVADPSIAGDPSTAELFAAGWRGLAFAGAVAVLAVLLLRASPVRWAPVVALGAALYLAPPVLLSVAGKYQVELNTSRAYLPVLVQVFGMAVLATAMLAALLRLAQARSRLMVVTLVAGAALVAGLTGGVTAFNNIRVVGIIQPDRASRELVEASAEHGAFAAIPPSSSVFFSDRDMAWQGPTPYEGYMYLPLMLSDKTGHVLDARLIPEAGPGTCAAGDLPVQQACAPASERGATWTRVRVRRDGGTVVVARLASPTPREFVNAAAERSLTVYRETDDGGTPEPPRLIGRTQKARPWSSDGGTWTVKREGDGWRIWELTIPRGPAPLASSLDDDHGYIDFLGLPAPAARAHMLGTRRLLP